MLKTDLLSKEVQPFYFSFATESWNGLQLPKKVKNRSGLPDIPRFIFLISLVLLFSSLICSVLNVRNLLKRNLEQKYGETPLLMNMISDELLCCKFLLQSKKNQPLDPKLKRKFRWFPSSSIIRLSFSRRRKVLTEHLFGTFWKSKRAFGSFYKRF